MSRVHTTSRFFSTLYQKVGFVKVRKLVLCGKRRPITIKESQGLKLDLSPHLEIFQSWVRISNGLNKFVKNLTEKSRILGQEETDSASTGQPSSQELRIVPYSQKETDKPSARAKLKPTSSSLQPPSLEQIPIHKRKWIDIEPTPERYSTRCCHISKRMITLLRHEQDILRAEDGAVEFWRLKRDINAKFQISVRWSNNTWVNRLQRGGERKKRLQLCTNYTGSVLLSFWAIQGHSGKTTVVPSLLDNMLIPEDFFEFIIT